MDSIQPQNKPAQQAGTGYTNLSQYLGANRNNQLGQTVAGGVQQAGQAATGAVNQAGQNFQQGAQAEQGRLNQLGQSAQNSLGNLGNIQQSDVDSYQSALSGEGKGPTGLDNARDLQLKSQNAQLMGQAAGSEQGRFGLLQRFVGKGQQYGLGQQTLDSALLGQQGQGQLRQARAATAGLGAQTNQAISAANAQGQQLQNQARQVADSAKTNLSGAVTGYDTNMANKLTADKAAQQSLMQQLSGQGTNQAITLDPALLQRLSDASGGVLSAGKNLYNTDLSPYISANSMYDNNQSVQSADDFNKIQALGKLAGNSGLAGTDQGNLLQSYLTNPDAVGKYDTASPINISSNSGLNDAINKSAGQYNSAQSTPNNQLKNTIETGMGGTGPGSTMSEQFLRNLVANYQNDPNYNNGQSIAGIGNYDQAQAALQANLAKQVEYNNQINNVIPGQYNAFRVLQGTPQAQSAGPIEGNGGQPLTS